MYLQVNAIQNYIDIPSYSSQSGYHQPNEMKQTNKHW